MRHTIVCSMIKKYYYVISSVIRLNKLFTADVINCTYIIAYFNTKPHTYNANLTFWTCPAISCDVTAIPNFVLRCT